MQQAFSYHRPGTLHEALTLLQRAGSVVLAGGTLLNAFPPRPPVDLVDLQALRLDSMRSVDGRVELGAMARLQDLVDSDLVPSLLRDLAKREGPNTLRNMATLGGTVAAADPESELLAGLLAFESTVTVCGPAGENDSPLEMILADRSLLDGAVIIRITVPVAGIAAADRTGRTPADRPIVSVTGRVAGDGMVRFACTGVAATPVLIGLNRLGSLDPPADFRGSAEYRRVLAEVLARRVADRLGLAP